MSVYHNIVLFINDVNPLPYFKNSLAKPYLEALDHIIDEEEEEELEEADNDEEGQEDQEEEEEGQEEQYDDDEDLYRKFIEDEFSASDVEQSVFIL